MTEAIKVLVALDEDVNRALVEAALPPAGRVNIVGLVENLDESWRILEDASGDLLVIVCGAAPQEAIGLIRQSVSGQPGRPIVVLCGSAPDYVVQTLFQAGADDVIRLPETPERVMFALEKALARRSGREAKGRAGLAPMICVLGPKGGAGKTVTSANLALGLASMGKRAAVVDLDLQFGDIGLALGLQPERTAYDLATSGGALDGEKLEAYLAAHQSGVRALLAPVRPDQASSVTAELMRDVYSLLRGTYEFVVVDTPPDFTPQVIAAVDASSHVCMVGMLDSLSLKNTKLGLETLELMGYDREAISLVLNRANSEVGLTVADVEAIVGRKPDVLVPSDRDVPRSVNEGEPIVTSRKRSAVAAAYRELAALFLREEVRVNGHGELSELASTNGHPTGRRRFRMRRKERA